MRNSNRNQPIVNAGSMADIAFLLLIFFLVTTTISADKGILRQLPADCPHLEKCSDRIAERNILNIFINKDNQIMVDEVITDISELKVVVKDFIDNNGASNCTFCKGKGLATASDHPSKAVISLKHDALTTYNAFIDVQDELSQAYFELREVYATSTFDKPISELTHDEILEVKKAYPFILSEAQTTKRK